MWDLQLQPREESYSLESLTGPGSCECICKEVGAKEFQGYRLVAQLLWVFLFVPCPP